MFERGVINWTEQCVDVTQRFFEITVLLAK